MTMGGPDEFNDVVPVEQIDREAAASNGLLFLRWTERQAAMTREGRADQYPLVQAFARHRIDVLRVGIG